MLVTTETVRDVLCCEVIELDKIIKSLSCTQARDMSRHISNMVSILMSPTDFKYINDSKEVQADADACDVHDRPARSNADHGQGSQ